ncbi:MAG: hypothetical protein AB1452_04170 [Pseudomonadota bacterium]
MPPRWRLPLLALGFVSLALGIAGGLARLGAFELPVHPATALHGALMASGFFGTVIGLERAVALGRLWAYAAPLCAGLGGIALVLGFLPAGLVILVLAAMLFSLATLMVVIRQPSLETATLLAGALAWVVGNTLLLYGGQAVPWWIAFFALTIGAERLELSRYLKRSISSRNAFIAIGVAVLILSVNPILQGAALVLLALWLLAYDLAWVTVRQRALPRYIAVCLLAGYFWLALGGVLLALDVMRDAALHAILVGFVFSMVFGHAPVILPAVLRVALPYSPALYAPLALLHASLALRVSGNLLDDLLLKQAGAWGNAGAIALFILTSIVLVATSRRSSAPL